MSVLQLITRLVEKRLTPSDQRLTLIELAEITGVSYAALRRAVAEGRVKATHRKKNTVWFSTVEAVEEAIAANRMRRP